MAGKFYLGLDFGTSGARAIAIDQSHQIVYQGSVAYGPPAGMNLIDGWHQTLDLLLTQMPSTLRGELAAIAIDGTSSSVILCDGRGKAIAEPLLYNQGQPLEVLQALGAIVPGENLVLNATSSLAKLWWWSGQPYFSQARYLLHQADWLGFLLHGQLGLSDYHNALKLGYDPSNLAYPPWLHNLSFQALLPQVLAPGTAIATVTTSAQQQWQLPANCIVRAGTTDSIAAFLACGVTEPGIGVTSLGSTLVLKLLSPDRLESLADGIYSHRLDLNDRCLWLTGGASNTGGAVLKHFFDDEALMNLSSHIDPVNAAIARDLNYYPLLKPGERFPLNDPHFAGNLEPRPEDPVLFLQGLLTGIAQVEALGYRKLVDLGAPPITQLYTAGGGSRNRTWTQIRSQVMGVPITIAPYPEAAYGSALIAAGLL